ncbi:MAG: hypothetical protein ACE15D_02985 [Candidatus Eisenbacteria bacterium]
MFLACATARLLIPCLALLLATYANAEVFLENFDDDAIDPALWTAVVYGNGPQIAETNHQLEISVPGWSYGQDFGAKLSTRFLFHGDFDVQVDFRLLVWPFGNGVRTALGLDHGYLFPPGVERISFGQDDYPWEPRESYLTDLDGTVCGVTATDDMTGTLRLVRAGAEQTGYYRSGGWVEICAAPAPTGDMPVQISVFTAYQFMGWDVSMAFDNFQVNSGELVDFPVATLATTWGAVRGLYR